MKCYFCGNKKDRHEKHCVVVDSTSTQEYVAGFKSGISGPSIVTSSHPYFTKGWIRGFWGKTTRKINRHP